MLLMDVGDDAAKSFTEAITATIHIPARKVYEFVIGIDVGLQDEIKYLPD